MGRPFSCGHGAGVRAAGLLGWAPWASPLFARVPRSSVNGELSFSQVIKSFELIIRTNR